MYKKLQTMIIAILLTLLLTCCTSTPKNYAVNEWVLPPDPIDTNGNPIVTYQEETDTVTMPFWYWRAIANYIILSAPITDAPKK